MKFSKSKRVIAACLAALIGVYSAVPTAYAAESGSVYEDVSYEEAASVQVATAEESASASSDDLNDDAWWEEQWQNQQEKVEPAEPAEDSGTSEENDPTNGTAPSEETDPTDGSVSSVETDPADDPDASGDMSLIEEPSEEFPPVYKDGAILLYSYEQLLLLGSDEMVRTEDADPKGIGLGDPLTDEDGYAVTYSLSGTYQLANDIPMPDGEIWQLPEGFSGRIAPAEEAEDKPLYDSNTNTIYLYHPRQLASLVMEDAGTYPVMSGDADPAQFGMGQLIYPEGEEDEEAYLTYSLDHHYVLSAQFCSDLPQLRFMAPKRAAGDAAQGGRDFPGQVIKEIDGKKYILIGNEEQLRAIGSDKDVFTPVYQTDYKIGGHVLDTDNNGQPIMLYGGDADLLESQNGRKNFDFQSIDPLEKPHGRGIRYYVGVDQSTGAPYLDATHATTNPNSLTEASWKTGEKYSTKANYIVFRDIDLSTDNGQDENWIPLMFNGTMIGAKSVNGEKLWDGDQITNATQITATGKDHRPVISNIKVEQNDPINLGKYNGVGFFATITNRTSTANVGISGGTVRVSNLELNKVNIKNNTSSHTQDQTILNAVTTALGGVLGFVMDNLLKVLSFGSVQLDLQTTLSNLLNARGKDPSIFATGAFAGRIVGDVVVEDCVVTEDVKVSNVNSRTGGFVGYTEGLTEYSGLSQVLGGTVDALSGLLNIIPAVGLGDLVTILLENALPVKNLIPTKYINPLIRNCGVDHLNSTVGSGQKDYAGGFVGQQIGTRIENCTVQDSNYTVQAKNYGGGFSGLARDAEIKGTLDGVGIDLSSLLRDIHPQSVMKDCSILNSNVSVAGENSLGGFVGAITSSYAIDCTVNSSQNLTVSGTGDYVGGFAGYGTVGWQSSLGKDENNEKSLLGTVRQLATGLLSTNASQGQQLLSIMGVAPAAILGCQIDCNEVNVHAGGSYAGGIVGKGDGIYLAESSQEMFDNLSSWNAGTLTDIPSNRKTSLTGLKSVKADKSYAGGVAGFMGSAAFQGLLNNVVGLGDFIGFTVNQIDLTGVDGGYTVEADENNAGGGFGAAVGGTITEVHLKQLKSVTANNRAAGFVGVAGPGELAGTGGLTVNLLGLDNVLQVSNLLSIGQGVEVHITESTVTGINDGYTVEATGSRTEGDVEQYTASGFIAKANSTKIEKSHAYKLKYVKAAEQGGYAGGFIGTSETGGLADVANQDSASVKSLIQANGLVKAIGYLIPSYTDCTVHYVDGGYVDADLAGGFVADFQSGTVDNETHKENETADHNSVYNIDHVKGRTYGGGFGGRVVSGGLAEAGKGVSILGKTGLNLDLTNLLSVMDVYVPIVKYAGVKSEKGFTVEAKEVRTGPGELLTGSAGGFIGYASGAQVSYSDVYRLKRTKVTPPEDLEAVNAPTYFNDSSSYAVTGGRYAGGYVGNMDIGSAASVGEGLGALGNTLNVSNVVSALSVVVSTIEHSNVSGCPGGFAVLATGNGDQNTEGKVGMSGGFAGNIEGGHIQDSHARNFSYIIGEVAAGGYVGNIKPGSVAKLLGEASVGDDGSILNKLLGVSDISNNLLTLVQSFVPTIRNSTTSCIPCGGAVRAHAPSDSAIQRGMAGGYVGHNEGAQIWGNNSNTWQSENDGVGRVFGRITDNENIGSYTGPQSLCKVDRIRSVYGYEYAGGFTGYMECASTAETGNIGLLGGLIKLDSVLSALKAVYPTEENTAVYGPLRNLDVNTWNSWIDYVGKYGGYGKELAKVGKVSDVTQLNAKLAQYAYGYHVAAGRSTHDPMLITEGGDAGGYVGLMRSGVITNGQAYDAKKITAMRSTGGFAGRMRTGGAAEFGRANILGLDLNIGQLLQAAQVFVPSIKSSSVRGYRAGLTVICKGTGNKSNDVTYECGYAGGYAGSVYGGQIWGDEAKGVPAATGCNTSNLRRVQGTNATGGYVGLSTAASVAQANTHASSGLLQGVLNKLINNPGNLAQVLQATVSTIRGGTVSAVDPAWGFVVEGTEKNSYPIHAGGFAGSLEATVVGSRKGESEIRVDNLRSVDGEYYAGGFFGRADVTSVASVSPDGDTTLLNLIQAGNISVLDAFRTYVYYAHVTGVEEGIRVQAHEKASSGFISTYQASGAAGGFGGGLMNGTVEHSDVNNINYVEAPNYAAGFIGYMGKNGGVAVNQAKVTGDSPIGQVLSTLGLDLGANAQLLNIVGGTAKYCRADGILQGFITKTTETQHAISGVVAEEDLTGACSAGFTGYGDIAQIDECHVQHYKLASSPQVAGGFIGRTTVAHLVDLDVSSGLTEVIVQIVNLLIKALYLNEAERLNLLNVDGGILGLKLLSDGDLLYVNLLGLKIGVSLSKDDPEYGRNRDAAIITIGSSTIKVPCDNNGITGETPNITIKLIEGNRTSVKNSTVTGIYKGYDVYGGGATNTSDGSENLGYAGGFVGYNDSGYFSHDEMVLCDVVRGTANQVGPFVGKTEVNSQSRPVSYLEGNDNKYSIYRGRDENLSRVETSGGTSFGTATEDTTPGGPYNRYIVTHLAVIEEHLDLKDAMEKGSGERELKAWESSAMAVLMLNIPANDNDDSLVPEPAEAEDPCETEIDLTVQKIWRDWNNIDRIRPDNIKVRILRSASTVTYEETENPEACEPDVGDPLPEGETAESEYTVLNPVPGVETDQDGWFTLTKEEHGKAFSATWRRVIKGLPAAERSTDPETGVETITYYTYKVEEAPVEGYFTEIAYDSTGYTATITNRHTPVLPFAGGSGDWWMLYCGAGILLLGALWRKRRLSQREGGSPAT